jgi:hypothetical protein
MTMSNTSRIAALLASLVLAACGGGAQTTANPAAPGPNPNTGANPYTGPVARDGDVLKFQQEFWSKARTPDRCGNCHSESGGQKPFVRSDNVNMAYDEAVDHIDTLQPSASEFVTKVSTPPLGHNCWVDDPGTCGAIMTTWIENWLGTAEGGGRQIVLMAPPDNDPSDSRNFPADTALFHCFSSGYTTTFSYPTASAAIARSRPRRNSRTSPILT